MRKALRYLVTALAALVLGGLALGYLLPVGHQATRSRTLPAPPERVFEAITDFARLTEWRPGVARVDVSGDPGVGQVVTEHGGDGAIPYRVEAYDPPRRLVTRIVGDDLPFGGTWTFDLAADPEAPDRTVLTIVEDGEVYNPVFRVLSRFVFGHHATIDAYLRDLARRFGEG